MPRFRNSVIALLLVFLVVGYGLATFNTFVSLEQGIEAQWAIVEVQYQRRHDLIPNLVNTAKGYMAHEREVFTRLADARAHYSAARTLDAKVEATREVELALGRLLAIAENYPDLKANDAMLAVMDELAGTENRISVERMRYNEVIRQYNVRVRSFPARLLAAPCGFQTHAYLEVSPAAAEAVKVDFS